MRANGPMLDIHMSVRGPRAPPPFTLPPMARACHDLRHALSQLTSSFRYSLRDSRTSLSMGQTLRDRSLLTGRCPLLMLSYLHHHGPPSDPIIIGAAAMADKSPSSHLHGLIKSAASKFTAADFHQLPSAKPQTKFFATTSDAETLLLSLAPRATALLRCERSLILSEAALLRWLAGVGDESRPTNDTHLLRQPGLMTARRDMDRRRVPDTEPQPLRSYLPSLLEHGPAWNGRHGEYILTIPVAGMTVASLAPPLSMAERKCVDFQIGQLLRRMSSLQSPNGKFGTAVAVLSPAPTVSDVHWGRTITSDLNSCHDQWSDAFLCMLESALRDAEDFRVAIRYEAVRDHVGRFRHFLDAVTHPCLVAIDAGEDAITLVSTLPDIHHQDDRRSLSDSESRKQLNDSAHGQSSLDTRGATRLKARPARASIRVTGIQEWSNCVFGDPLFASVLSRNVSPEIWNGFKSPLQGHGVGEPLDDMASARIRRLLYECHHAVTTIVREYCRRRSDSDDRELPARKRLTQVLRILDGLDDFGRERRPHPSGDTSPAKRTKSLDGSDV
ncbi:hypothetical protein L249_7484 [Ophiocordyceps polyrhachis-furcata BCC 54312]|uniref:Uncharacterized protein n=1 Tax=Ophiocordyceps polyrhachis-furcata BCC 54312 TaxID=1330021 RepID=A0A367LBB8_9HYPO|nr:hypothetical protein L249_7484 [Ophiocordyceps polyrhachis-furcata BCC 54312]